MVFVVFLKKRTKVHNNSHICKKKRKNLRYFCIFSRFGEVGRGLVEENRGFGERGWCVNGYRRGIMARECGERGILISRGHPRALDRRGVTLAH